MVDRGAVGILVHGSLMGHFFYIYIASFTVLLVHCGSLVRLLDEKKKR